MKKIFFFPTKNPFSLSRLKFLVLGVLIVSLLGTTPVWGKDYKSTLPQLTVKDNGNLGVDIQFKFKGAVFASKDVDGTAYQIPHIYGFSHMTDAGSPQLPARNVHIAVPYGDTATIQMLVEKFQDEPGEFLIHPTLKPAADCKDCPEPKFELDQDVYGSNDFFPQKAVEIVECDTFRGVSVAVVQIRPVQYNPVTNEVRIYTDLKFKVKFSGNRSFGRYAENSRHANRMVKNVVLNRQSVPTGMESIIAAEELDGPAKDYIMIVHSNYLTAAEALATWKRQLGYSVEIVSQSSWTTTQVKNELQTRYDSWTPKPLFFLIFGDHGDVPAEYPSSRYTDLYYAEMEGSGYKPEMAYGRIFAGSAAEAQLIVDKIINYEKTPPTQSSFYTNAMACAYFQDTNDYDTYADRRFTHTSEDLRNYVMGQGYSVNRVYATGSSVDPQYYNNGNYSPPNTPIPAELKKPGFPWDGDYNDIINAIDAGRFLVWHRDHGDTTLWGDPYFTTTHIGQLNNGDLLPIVMSVNCLTGQFTGATECFCERFLRLSGGGCVGIFGATNLSYSGPNDGYAPGIIDAIWPDPGIDPQYGSGGLGDPIPAHAPIYTMGDILNHSKVAMEYLWGLHQTTWELHHYFGDPAMKIWTAVPTVTTASHDASILPGATTLNITSSNCANGTATLVYEDTIKAKTTLAGDGTGTLTFDALSGNEPNAILTISKHNFKPYVANIPVEGGVPPVADFSADNTTVMATGTVQFTDLTINSPVSWDWTFEGGSPATSTDQHPAVVYNTPGLYTVTLTASNSTGSDTETKVDYITVTTLQAPAADFSASSTNISAGESVDFTDLSSNYPNSWDWTFAGGTPGTSTDQNPTVTYNTPGRYTVTLTSGNAAGSDTETKVDYIDVAEKPYCPSQGNTYSMEWVARVQVADIDNSSGAAGYTDFTSITGHMEADSTVNVTLTPGFSGTVYTEYWKVWIDYNGDHDFEDAGEEVFSGVGSSAVSGSFTVQAGVDIVTRMRVSMKYSGYPTPCETFTYGEVEDYTVDIGPGVIQPPVADFSASATVITEGDSVTFTDLSTNNPDAWDWTFEGGTPATSTDQNPVITYYTAGTYTVTLTATNAAGSDSETKVDYITVEPAGQPPVADFSASATTITEGGSVTFTDQSTNNPDTWNWTFEGGTPGTSTDQNPVITYFTTGTYTVTLTASNAYGSDTEIKVDYITVLPPTCPGTITNPDFETGDTSNWTASGDLNITTDAHSGSYAVSLNGANSSLEQVVADLCANTTYTLSCWGKAKGPADVYLGVKDYGSAEQTVQFTDFKNYVQKSITFTTGSSNTSATIFVIKTGSKFTGVIDDFTIVKN